MLTMDRKAINKQMMDIMKPYREEFKDIPNEGNNIIYKHLLLMNIRQYELKKKYADELKGTNAHAIVIEDLSSMVEHINNYRNLLGLSLM
jgi:hypothetical protein